jgi:plasmid stability protein
VISQINNNDITIGDGVAQLIVRRLDDGIKERLKARARRHGRSLEAEARAILEAAANSNQPTRRRKKKEKGFGTLMHERFGKAGLTEEEAQRFQQGIDELNSNWQLRIPNFEG